MNPVKVEVDESVNDMGLFQKKRIVCDVLSELSLCLGEFAVRQGLRSYLCHKGYKVIEDSVFLDIMSLIKISK